MNSRWLLPVLVVALCTQARSGSGAGDATAPHPLTTAVAAGRHVRLATAHGPVHVWVPAGYHPDGAATVVYVHGYYTDVDTAWKNHQLPEQFALSAINALFIACEAPRGSRSAVSWTSLGELLGTVAHDAAIPRPMGPVIAVGHSGAFRTLVPWLDEPWLDQVVLVDALYAEIEPFRAWLTASPKRRLIDVGQDTVRWGDELARELIADGEPVVYLERFPEDERLWPAEARTARVLAIRSQHFHMPLVTGGVALPMLLRLLPMEILADGPWTAPLGDLPPL